MRKRLLLLALLAAAPWAQADSRQMPAAQMLPAYRNECAACHMAYPPGLLPAASWARMVQGLDKHYGSDASLDAATVHQLSTWLQQNAATYKRVRAEGPPPQDRITQSAWFARKHREVAAATWKRTAIQSPANCMACHTRADQGDFDDDNVRIPR